MNKKFLWLALVIAIVMPLIMVATQILTTNPQIKDLPIAIVNRDQGKLGDQVVSQLKTAVKKVQQINLALS